MNGSTPQSLRGFSVMSIVFAFLGFAFYWWVPLGMVLGVAGLTLGVADALIARRRSLNYRLALVGIALSVLALALDFSIAALGLQTVTRGG